MITERSFLEKNLNNPRNYGMFETQSSNTFQNSIKTYSIPKSDRWKSLYAKPANDCLYIIPSIKSNRATGIGYGKRLDLRYIRGKGCPSPDTYSLASTLNLKNGISIKSRIPDTSIIGKSKLPCPGDYNINLKDTKLPLTLKFRHGLYYDDELKLKGHCISPQAYTPKINYTLPTRFNNIKFGTEQRIVNDVRKDLKNNPGPGCYNLPQIFDLKRKRKPPIN